MVFFSKLKNAAGPWHHAKALRRFFYRAVLDIYDIENTKFFTSYSPRPVIFARRITDVVSEPCVR